MGKITAIGTVHRDNGAANALALASILQSKSPKVIFLETPAAKMVHYFSKPSLESRAIALLSKHQSVDLVPVDIEVMGDAEILDFHRLFDFFKSHGNEDSQSIDRNIQSRTRSSGFYYLNSPDYIKAQTELEKQYDCLVESQGDEDINGLQLKWKAAHLRRERAMIENIASYCRVKNFDNAVFLVGAAHVRPLRCAIESKTFLFADVEWVFGA